MSRDATDLDRFTGFLLRWGETYHSPPETPDDVMWETVDAALSEALDPTDETRGDLPGTDEALVAAAANYNAPPVTPHDEMWDRIGSAWDLRLQAPVEARQAGLDDLAATAWGVDGENRRRPIGRWALGMGIAASLAIGIAIGRISIDTGGAGVPVAATDGAADAGTLAPEQGSPEDPTGDLASQPVETLFPPSRQSGEFEPLETRRPDEGVQLATDDAATTRPVVASRDDGVTAGAAAGLVASPSRWDVAVRLATTRHLGQAETLLTSFRADPDDAGGQGKGLPGWARELLGETRLLLDLPVQRAPRETELLQELELVLAQIARLGPDAPPFERDLVADGLSRQGTIARLRAATPPGAAATIGT